LQLDWFKLPARARQPESVLFLVATIGGKISSLAVAGLIDKTFPVIG
jgi:hypothetical protein